MEQPTAPEHPVAEIVEDIEIVGNSRNTSITKDDELRIYAARVKELTTRSRDGLAMCFTTVLLILCGVFFVFCPRCLFGVLILCACLCPFFNSLNAPLWLAIVMLTLTGWSFTGGAFSISWNAKTI